MRILFLTQFFPPEIGAPQTRILETARDLQDLGHEVVVLTGLPNYPSGVVPEEYRGKIIMREKVSGIRVLRAWLYATPNRGFLRRTLGQASFALSALPATRRLPWRPDVISVDMHPLFLCLTAAALSRAWGIPYVLNAGDLIPDQAVAYGVMKNPLAIRFSRTLSNVAIDQAACIVPFTRGIRDALIERGIAEQKLELIYYGADTNLFQAGNSNGRSLPQVDSLVRGERFVVTYAGTHGLPHGLEIVLQAADGLRHESDIHFLLVGDGGKKAELMAEAHRLDLGNVTFLDPMPRDVLPALYQRSDVCLVTLRRWEWLRRYALSSKVFDAMAAGRPVIAAAEGETAELVKRAGAGLCVQPEESSKLVTAIRILKSNPGQRKQMGTNGRQYITQHFGREQQSRRFEMVLRRAIARSPV